MTHANARFVPEFVEGSISRAALSPLRARAPARSPRPLAAMFYSAA